MNTDTELGVLDAGTDIKFQRISVKENNVENVNSFEDELKVAEYLMKTEINDIRLENMNIDIDSEALKSLSFVAEVSLKESHENADVELEAVNNDIKMECFEHLNTNLQIPHSRLRNAFRPTIKLSFEHDMYLLSVSNEIAGHKQAVRQEILAERFNKTFNTKYSGITLRHRVHDLNKFLNSRTVLWNQEKISYLMELFDKHITRRGSKKRIKMQQHVVSRNFKLRYPDVRLGYIHLYNLAVKFTKRWLSHIKGIGSDFDGQHDSDAQLKTEPSDGQYSALFENIKVEIKEEDSEDFPEYIGVSGIQNDNRVIKTEVEELSNDADEGTSIHQKMINTENGEPSMVRHELTPGDEDYRAKSSESTCNAQSLKRTYRCAQCNYQSSTSRLLQKHELSHSDSLEPFKCEKCDFQTKHRRLFQQHCRIHKPTGEQTNLKDRSRAQIINCNDCSYADSGTRYLIDS